jgi:hypothetical protein
LIYASGNTKNKPGRGVNSSIPIAAAIASYSAAEMFKYMNIKGNPLIYMDTDGVVLKKPLDPLLIGKEIGKMKLEYEIKRAVYADKKVYAVETLDGRLIKKAVGLNSKELNFQDYIDYLRGVPFKTSNNVFLVN